jgi:hypothetical protein
VLLFFYDFLLPHTRLDPVEFDLVAAFCSPPLEDAKVHTREGADGFVPLCVFEDFATGVVFLFHGYTLPQISRKATGFFTAVYYFVK